jgi:hypothetical protein
LLRLAGAAALASLALAPFLYQYWLAHTQQGHVRLTLVAGEGDQLLYALAAGSQ